MAVAGRTVASSQSRYGGKAPNNAAVSAVPTMRPAVCRPLCMRAPCHATAERHMLLYLRGGGKRLTLSP